MMHLSEQNKDTFCYYPFMHISMQADGSLRSCCNAAKLEENGSPILYDVDKAFNSDHMNRIRSDLLNGIKAPECKKCWDHEKFNAKSMRQIMLSVYNNSNFSVDILTPNIQYMDINLSNKCNLKCMMCFPTRSNQIGIEMGYNNPYMEFPLYDKVTEIAHNLRRIRFTGGEPLLHDDMYNILDYLIDNDYSKNIYLKYNTNATVTRDDFFDKIKHFRYIKFDISIDGYGRRDEYIRFPSKWESIERNILYFKDMLPKEKSTMTACTVCQNLSIVGMKELEDWISKLGIGHFYNRLTHPYFLQCHILPESAKKKAKESLEKSNVMNASSFVTEMMNPYTQEEKNAFINYVKKKDKLRGINILDYCPEFEEWFS